MEAEEPFVLDPAKLQRIWDLLTIQQILARYVPALDGARADVVADDFAADGVFDLGALGVFTGRDEIHGFASRERWSDRQLSALAEGGGHFLSPPMIVIEQNKAVATCTSQFYLREGDRYVLLRLTAVRVELRRTSDGWRITHRWNRLIDSSAEGVELYRSAFEVSGDPTR